MCACHSKGQTLRAASAGKTPEGARLGEKSEEGSAEFSEVIPMASVTIRQTFLKFTVKNDSVEMTEDSHYGQRLSPNSMNKKVTVDLNRESDNMKCCLKVKTGSNKGNI